MVLEDNIKIQLVKDLKNLPPSVRESYHTLTMQAFPPSEHSYNSHISLAHSLCRYVAITNNTIISVVSVFGTFEWFEDRMISVGGIGGVVTHPQYQRKGLATQLLQLALQFLKDLEVDLVFLYGPKKESWTGVWYQKHGFTHMDKDFQYADKDGIFHKSNNGYVLDNGHRGIYNMIINSPTLLSLSHGKW